MARVGDVTMLIYEEEVEFIKQCTSNYPNIETGGDLFGLWQSESEVVVQLVIGPGLNCRRTQTAFFQDTAYLSQVGRYLTSAKGLCNIGEWHSHHSLNLHEPSGGDRATVFRNMPGLGLKRFLLIIATIRHDGPGMNGFMFTSLGAAGNGRMVGMKVRILPGQNPYRRQSEVSERLRNDVEEGMRTSLLSPQPVAVEEENTPKIVRKPGDDKKEKKQRIKEEKRQKKQKKRDKKAVKQEMKNAKLNKLTVSKEGNRWPFRTKREKSYNVLPQNNGGSSGCFPRRGGSDLDAVPCPNTMNTRVTYHETPQPIPGELSEPYSSDYAESSRPLIYSYGKTTTL